MIDAVISRTAAPRLRAFSLIELIVVLVLMAMMAAAATLSAAGVIHRQRLSRGCELVEQFDLAMRREAHRHRQPVIGTIDRSRRTLTVTGSDKRTFALPKRITISAFRSSKSTSPRRDNQILVNRDGVSSSYAIELSSGDTKHWIMIVGRTGQVIRDLDSVSVTSILESR